jgi:Carboxypeptidase regulatory-like domain
MGTGFSWKMIVFIALALVLSMTPVSHAQAVSGDIAGTVLDKTGATVPKAKVTAVNTATDFTRTVDANEHGEFSFSNLPVGFYNVTVDAPGFAKTQVANFPVELNKTSSLSVQVEVKSGSTTIEVTAGAATIDTTTPQIGGTFDTIASTELPAATEGLGVLNLALYQAGVTGSGGVGVGTGPSVGGQRPRNNDFTIEGVDNNDKTVTGPLVTVPNDSVQEFSTLQNVFSPEFGHSTGGQFNTIVKSGTNGYHGLLYDYTQNRNFDAIDQSTINAGLTSNPRFDDNRFGGNFGGPIIKNKLFFFVDSEYEPVGAASVPISGVCTPTAAGYATLAALPPGLSPDGTTINSLNTTNLAILQKFAAPAPTSGNCPFTVGNANNNADFICTGGSVAGINSVGQGVCPQGTPVAVDSGLLPLQGPNFTNNYRLVASGDYNYSEKDQFRIRYIYNLSDGIDTAAEFPVFFQPIPSRSQFASISEFHTFKPNVTNEFRFGFNRFFNNTPSGAFSFPGLDQFPNLEFFDLDVQLGPDPNAPQSTVQNLYQFTDGVTWVHGNHNIKIGGEYHWFISPQTFTQRSRGDYDYSSVGSYLYDVNPDQLAERSTGDPIYLGNEKTIAWYVNDSWRIRPSLSINLGVRYEYTTIPIGEQQQSLNSISSDPSIMTPKGPLVFNAPRAPKDQFEPRIGIAWSPGGSANTVIRAGFSLGYDTLFDNLGLLTLPPQLSQTQDRPQSDVGVLNNFLANGAIPPGAGGVTQFPNAAAARAVTAAFLPGNFRNPAAVDWTLGIQHSFANSYVFEARYVGTHGYYLPVQDQIDKQSPLTPTLFLPTFTSQPTQAALNALTVTLPELSAPGNNFVPAYAAAGFQSNITSYQPIGNSIYHGLALQLTRRFSHGLQFVGAYTWSHAIDDSTAEVFSTVLTPRRPQDSQDLGADRSTSALDRRQRFTLATVYDMPYFKGSSSWAMRNLAGNWLASPVYTYEAPEYIDVQSGDDANLNGDSAGDRTLLNPSGVKGTGSGVTALCQINTCGATTGPTPGPVVAYLAANPNAQYIQAGPGALEPNNGFTIAGRNTLRTRPINNLDFSIGKNFHLNERMYFTIQAQAFNLLNHPQFAPGFPSAVNPIGYTASRSIVEPSDPGFNNPGIYFPSHARNMQLAAKFYF